MKRRISSTLMALVLCLTLLPAAAYADGGGRMAEGYGGLHTGLEALGDGSVELAEGGRALREGTHDMQTNTADLPDILQAEIDRLAGGLRPGRFFPGLVCLF